MIHEWTVIRNTIDEWARAVPLECEWSEMGQEEVNGLYHQFVATIRDANPYRLFQLHIGISDVSWQWCASGGRRGPLSKMNAWDPRAESLGPYVDRLMQAVRSEFKHDYLVKLFGNDLSA